MGRELLAAARHQELDALSSAPVRAVPRRAARHILVSEDNPVNQKVLVRLLEQRGYTVEAVVTGQLAVEAMQRGAYDLVLMDCQTPEMDGFEATETTAARSVSAARTARRATRRSSP